jgi:hypothetical protein
MKLNNSHPVGWLLLFLPAFPSHIPAVGNVGRFLYPRYVTLLKYYYGVLGSLRQSLSSLVCNKYPPAKPEVLRLLAPQRGLIAIAKSKPKTEKPTNGRLPELSNFGSPPAEPGVYLD